MTFNRFRALRNNLHCLDNQPGNNSGTHRFWKVKSIMNNFLKILKEEQPEKIVCVDEQMIPYKGSLGLKQYIKENPNS